MLHASLESLVQKVQTGVVINFEKIGPDPPPLAEGKQLWNLKKIICPCCESNLEFLYLTFTLCLYS